VFEFYWRKSKSVKTISTRKDNTLDLIITNLPNQVQRVEVIPGLSDHDIVFTDLLLRQ
jgi:hypothetical protein